MILKNLTLDKILAVSIMASMPEPLSLKPFEKVDANRLSKVFSFLFALVVQMSFYYPTCQ